MSFNVPPLKLKDSFLSTKLPAFVMAIVNCTPDSFHIDSRFSSETKIDLQRTTEYVLEQFEMGADIVDIGGESARPGSQYISTEDELERIIPLVQEVRRFSNGVISIDTRKSIVLKECLTAGANILNDISALEDDIEMVKVVAKEKIPVILMHKRDIPLTMQQNTVYNDIVKDVCNYLSQRVLYATQNGIEDSKIILDAGIGFAKQTKENISLIKSSTSIAETVAIESGINIYGTLVGLSRKTCIGDMTGKAIEKRLPGTLAANMIAVQHGARILRVHDTVETVDMLRVLRDIG